MPTLSASATDVMRENVRREGLTHHALRAWLPAPPWPRGVFITHHALRITCLASRANLAARRFHRYRRATARGA